jgi:O-antigen/teichoic acid export membrane protein
MKLALPTFWKHVATVLAGSLGAQALPLMAAPLLTRLVSPAEMGAFGMWLGAVAVTAVGATLRLETAMILDHGRDQQQTCFSVVAWSATLVALAVTLGAVAARWADFPMAAAIPWYGLLTVGIGAWLTAYQQTTLAYATSHNAFGKAARARVIGAATIVVAQLALLHAGLPEGALMAGQLIGLLAGLGAATLLLSPPLPRTGLRLSQVQRSYLQRHRGFWHFTLPSNLLNATVSQLPLFLIGLRFGVLAAGLFALTQRVMAAPIALLAASVLEVFKRESVREFQAHGHCREAYRHTFKALALLGFLPALVLFLFSPALFAWIFGEPWRAAGELARILAPLCFLNFVASPLSYVFLVAGKQKTDLTWQIGLFAMTTCAFALPGTLHESVWWYTAGYSLLYLLYLHMSWQCSQNRVEAVA